MHKQHLPSLLTVAAGFTSPGSPMAAGTVRCQCNALVKKTNATLGCIQEGISKCKELTPLHKELISSSPLKLSEYSPSSESRKKLKQVQRRTTETGGMRGESKRKSDEQFNMEKTLERKKNLCYRWLLALKQKV